jgi:hypothetical protein
MAKKEVQLWTVAEKKIGGSRRRFSEYRFASRAEAAEMARNMNRLYKGRFTYTVVKAPKK